MTRAKLSIMLGLLAFAGTISAALITGRSNIFSALIQRAPNASPSPEAPEAFVKKYFQWIERREYEKSFNAQTPNFQKYACSEEEPYFSSCQLSKIVQFRK